MEQFDQHAEALMSKIARAYFNSEEVFDDPGEIAAVLRAHAEDHEEDDKLGEAIVLRMAARRLDDFANPRESHGKRLRCGREALALIRFYRRVE